jgi:hypothetical protein
MAILQAKLPSGAGAGGTVRAQWRTRWFWRWQAWRLRKHRAHETACGVAIIDNFPALEQHGYTDALFDLHGALVRQAPGMLPENAVRFRERLMRELGGTACATLFAAPDGSIGGYCWARVSSPADALAHYRQIPTLDGLLRDEWLQLEARIAAGSCDAPLLALNGLGLGSAYRHGFAPLKKLLKPLIEMGVRHGATRALWWAPHSSPLFHLSLAFGADRVLETPGCAFFMLADVRPLALIFAALPASGIAELLGRVAPPRPARPARQPARTAPEPAAAHKPRVA